MLPDRVSNPGPLTYESGALPIALRGPLNSLTTRKQKTKFRLQFKKKDKPKLYRIEDSRTRGQTV